jgi:phosphoribosyl 1,2-cyclic phosphodiesterase
MSAFVRFWGTRGSIPTPGHATKRYGGNTSCVEIRIDDTLFICDGGTGLRELGLNLLGRGNGGVAAHMFFSHMHWDHIQGFPFFVPAYAPANRIRVYESAPSETRVQRLLNGQMSSEYFPVTFGDLGAQIGAGHFENGELSVDGVRVRCIQQRHPGQSYAYSFEKNGTKIVYATDSELDLELLNAEQAKHELEAPRQHPASIARFVEGADLLIADAQYTDREYPQKVGWGHARANTVVDLALQAGVRQCAMFHHDPMHIDEAVDDKVRVGRERAGARGSELKVFGAREGLELKF